MEYLAILTNFNWFLLQVYLAIAKQQIIGVCVTHPIEQAHRLASNDGIDCYSMETYPAK